MTEGYVYRDVLPFSAMVIMQSVAVGLNTLFKAATMEGMSYHVFVAYIHAIGALVLLLPAHFFSYRSRVVPPLSFHVVCKIGFLGMIGSSSQIMGYTGINYSSPTLDSAISNITPAFTFILAVAFRIFLSFFRWVIKTQIMKEYPDELTVVFLYDLVVSIVAAVVALITEGTSPTAWILGPNIALASVFCSGILGSCLNIIVHTWALRIKGPVFVAMFRPLSIVIALVMGVVFLGDTLHLGSLVGAAVISIGFYTMMWGKAQEEQDLEE
ncbi:WAT1-related protein At5g40210 [Linum perenne]